MGEYAAFLGFAPLLAMLPGGDGHPVLVLPPFAATDTYTQPLRGLLHSKGYAVHGWGLGRNDGLTAEVAHAMPERLRDVHERYGRRVSLVGWSAGGILARELARDHPDLVRQVITLGTPFRLRNVASTNADSLYRLVRHRQVRPQWWDTDEADRPRVPVPVTSIYTRSDGVADWRACLEEAGPQRENIEVDGSHCGLGHNPTAVYAVVDRLRQREGAWRPFRPAPGFHHLFPSPADWSAA